MPFHKGVPYNITVPVPKSLTLSLFSFLLLFYIVEGAGECEIKLRGFWDIKECVQPAEKGR